MSGFSFSAADRDLGGAAWKRSIMKRLGDKKSTILAIGLSSIVLSAIAIPAYAEGSWSSNLSNVEAGFSSRSWQDSALDNVATAATFSSCSATGPGFTDATLNLYDEFGAFPDQSVGSITNYCDTSNWGAMTRSDRYHWTIDGVNGGDYGFKLTVGSVYQQY
jgi:hypothetical protein